VHIPHFCPISQKQRARHGNTHGKRYHGSLQWKCGGTCDNGGGVLGGLGWAARVAVVGRIGGRRGRKRTCPRCSNAAGLNTHAGPPRHASTAPEVPRKDLSSPRLEPSALLLATSHLLNITSVSTIRMLAGVWAAVHLRACAHLEATPTNSALQEQPRFKLEAWNRFCRKAPTLVPGSRRTKRNSSKRKKVNVSPAFNFRYIEKVILSLELYE
jgi:hypothetical protein